MKISGSYLQATYDTLFLEIFYSYKKIHVYAYSFSLKKSKHCSAPCFIYLALYLEGHSITIHVKETSFFVNGILLRYYLHKVKCTTLN